MKEIRDSFKTLFILERTGKKMSVEFHCPSCGKKLFTYETRVRKYEKITKECKKCGATYLDPRCHELAIDGIPEDEFSIPSYLILAVIGGLVLWRGLRMFGMHQIGTPIEVQWLLPTVFSIIGVALILGGIIEIILILTGGKRKILEKKYNASCERMKDRSYVYTLQKLGYIVPDRYTDGF